MIREEDGSANSAPSPRGRAGRESSGSAPDLTNVHACAVYARAASLSDGDREKIEAPTPSGHRHCLAPCVWRACARRRSGVAAESKRGRNA
jgi:hypothetical protein